MSIAFAVKVLELEKRVAALEAAKTAPIPVSQTLTRANAQRKADGERTREKIRQIISNNVEGGSLRANSVRLALSRRDSPGEKLPALRTVQWHMRAMRNPPHCAGSESQGKK